MDPKQWSVPMFTLILYISLKLLKVSGYIELIEKSRIFLLISVYWPNITNISTSQALARKNQGIRHPTFPPIIHLKIYTYEKCKNHVKGLSWVSRLYIACYIWMQNILFFLSTLNPLKYALFCEEAYFWAKLTFIFLEIINLHRWSLLETKF